VAQTRRPELADLQVAWEAVEAGLRRALA
jgi:hypothetical protein